jgi:hypothetical protein
VNSFWEPRKSFTKQKFLIKSQPKYMDPDFPHGQANANANANGMESQSIYGTQHPRPIGQNQNGMLQNDSRFGDSNIELPRTQTPSNPAKLNSQLPEIGEKSKFFPSRNSEKFTGV